MRILCESCKTQYHIDDRFMRERGIRAQCPKCQQITVIKKSDPAIVQDADQRLPNTKFCVNCGRPIEGPANDPIPICATCKAAESEGSMPGVPTTEPVEITEQTGGGREVSGLELERDVNPFQAFAGPGMESTDAVPVGSGQYRIKKSPDGRIYGPFDHATIVEWIQGGKVTSQDEISGTAGGWRPVWQHPSFKDSFSGRLEVPKPAKVKRPRRPFPTGIVLTIVAILAVGGLGVAGWQLGWIDQISERLSRGSTETPDRTDQRIAAIREAYPGMTGDPEEFLDAGLGLLEGDTIPSYEQAREQFEISVALAPDNYEALAYLAETYALLAWYDGQDSLLSDGLLFAIRAAERQPDLMEAHRAHATVLLARPNAQNIADARAILEQKLMNMAKEDPAIPLLLGVSWRDEDPHKADMLLAKAVSMSPRSIRPRLERADLAAREARFALAVESLKPVTRRSLLASYRLGELYQKSGRYREASNAYKRAAVSAARSRDTSPQWHVRSTLSQAVLGYQFLGETRNALGLIRRIKPETLEEISDSELRTRALIHRATLERLNGRPGEAVVSAQAAIQEGTLLTPAARLQLALAEAALGNPAVALQSLEKAQTSTLSKRDQSVMVLAEARLKAQLGVNDDARNLFEEASRLDPYNVRAVLDDAVLVAISLKEDEIAIARVRDLASIDPLYYRNRRAPTDYWIDRPQNTFTMAVNTFSQVRDRQTYLSHAWSALGITQFYAGKRTVARGSFQRALEEDNDFDPTAHFFLGLDYDLSGQHRQALQAYQAANRPDLQGAHLYTALARTYGRIGDTQQADDFFARAINDDPSYAPAYYWKGEYQLRRNKRDDAKAEWRKALQRDPDYVRAWQALYKTGS